MSTIHNFLYKISALKQNYFECNIIIFVDSTTQTKFSISTTKKPQIQNSALRKPPIEKCYRSKLEDLKILHYKSGLRFPIRLQIKKL